MYKPDILSSTAKETRGKGVRRQLLPATVIPPKLVGVTIKECATIYTIFEGNVLCYFDNAYMTNLVSCSHEEVDNHIFLHVADAVIRAGYRKVCVRTVDANVIVLASAHYKKTSIKPDELWVAFGTGSHFHDDSYL